MKRNSTKALRPSNSIYDTRRKYSPNMAEAQYNGATRDYEDRADYVKLGAIKAVRLG